MFVMITRALFIHMLAAITVLAPLTFSEEWMVWGGGKVEGVETGIGQ